MKKLVLRTCLIVLMSITAATANAAVIRVPDDQPTIQQAINVAVQGDTVLVSPGTYFENIDFRAKAITVRSERGAAQTIMDGNKNGLSVVTFESGETRNSVLSGFTIQHGGPAEGAGVDLLGSSATIIRNVFVENEQAVGYFGAAIAGNSASPRIEANTFMANSCDTQFLAGVLSFVNSSSPVIINNVVANNPCRGINLTVPEGNNPEVANNTIVGNTVGMELDLVGSTSTQTYANNIIVDNDVGLEVLGVEPPWANNLVFGNDTNYSGLADQTGMNGNISANPRFVSPRNLNFELRVGSPAIDAGTLSVPRLPAKDFAGNPRIVDGDGDGTALPDIGAFEFVP
jgi:serine protease